MGMSTYPESTEAVLCICNAYQPPLEWGKGRQDTRAGTKEGAIFAQTEGDNLLKAKLKYHNCSKKGHIARECAEGKGATKEEQIHTNIEEEGSNEDIIDQGKTYLCRRERGVVNKAPTRQSEHGQ
jgi:hypothetical protein